MFLRQLTLAQLPAGEISDISSNEAMRPLDKPVGAFIDCLKDSGKVLWPRSKLSPLFVLESKIFTKEVYLSRVIM